MLPKARWLPCAMASMCWGLDEIVSFTVPANTRSRSVMERIGMHRDEAGDFAHPALPADHRLSQHVLYRIGKNEAL